MNGHLSCPIITRRAMIIANHNKELKQRYEHVRNSWRKSDSMIKIISVIISLTTVCSFIIINVIGGFGLIPVISLTIIDGVIAGMGGLSAFKSTMISMRWTKRKKKEFRARIKLIEEYLKKFFYYIKKVKKDRIINIEELKDFDELLAEFNNKLLELKFKQTKKDYNMISSMIQPGTFIWQAPAKAKEANHKTETDLAYDTWQAVSTGVDSVIRLADNANCIDVVVNKKERKKIDKDVQKEIKKEALFNAKKDLQLASAEADPVLRLA